MQVKWLSGGSAVSELPSEVPRSGPWYSDLSALNAKLTGLTSVPCLCQTPYDVGGAVWLCLSPHLLY